MGDPTPKDPLGNARTLRNILERLRVLEQARPLQTAFNDASAAQGTADSAQSTASGALGVAQGASYDASVAQQQAQAAQTAAASKTKTTWSTAVPDNSQNPGAVDGDTWYVTNGTGGPTIAQYRWNAATLAWTLTPIDGAVLRNVIADTVKAGAVDGLTITGATIRSAASGQRIEMVGQRLNVYGSGATAAAIIAGQTAGDYSQLGMAAQNPAGIGQLTVTGLLSFGSSASWTPNLTCDVQSMVGFATGNLAGTRLYALGGWTSNTKPMLVMDGTNSSAVALNASSFNYTASGSTPKAVISGAGNSSGDVYVTATDFRLPSGTSIIADTGWVNLSLRSGYITHSGRTPQVRRKGGVCYMRGGITTSSGTFTSATYQVAADLPAGFTAPVQNSYFLSFLGTNGASGTVSIEGTTVRLTPGGSGVGYMYLNNVIYFED